MNIVIVGVGEVGRHLAQSLTEKQHNLSIIESSETIANELKDRFDAHVLCSNGTSVSTLAEANVAEADLLMALSGDDNANLVAASLGKAMGARRTIARVHASTIRDRWLFDIQQHFRIDHVFSTQRLAAIELAKFVRNPEGLLVRELARGKIEVQQVAVSADSPLLGSKLRDLGLPARLRIGSINRGAHLIIPGAEDELEPNDLITLFGAPRVLSEVLPRFSTRAVAEEEVSVVIFGGGEYGFSLAQMLEGRRYRVRIIERNEALCRELSNALQRTVIIHGDATSVQQLKEEQVGRADFFIAASEDDEDNVMTCLQAKSLGTRYCLTLIHRADYADVVSRNSEQLQIRAAVSPREATNADLLRYISTDRSNTILEFPDGTEVSESVIPTDSPLIGRQVAAVKWPRGSGLVALLRGSEAIVPGPNDTIEAGDIVYALVAHAARKAFARLLVP
ncbi:MAG: Trk system potassium transporter TrkA [Verrucomicrobiales bacterium]|nr:Trk system potassium transporter TrkA [Verrucomicrobiales bacterium]MCP5526183.1 Trk system potassium transporter TrkA [Verrucomicrobiales bacterium]